jgi:hypothetical protein
VGAPGSSRRRRLRRRLVGARLLNRVCCVVVPFDFRDIGFGRHIDNGVRSLRDIVVGRHIDIAVVSLGEEDAFGPTAPDEAGLLCTAGINPPHEPGWHSVVFAPVQPAQQCGSAEGADTYVENKTDQRVKLILTERYLNPSVYGTLRDIGVYP